MAAKVAVAAVTQIADIVSARRFATDRRRPCNKTVVVEVKAFVFVVNVVCERKLREEAFLKQILPIQVGGENIIFTQWGANVVQAAVGVFL